MRNALVAFCFLLACTMQSSADQQSSSSSFVLKQQNADGWQIEYISPLIPSTSIIIDGVSHLLFTGGAAGFDGEPGKPQLPIDALSLGVPEGADLRVDIVDPIYTESINQLVAPNPSYTYTEEKEAIPHYDKNSTYYAQNRFFPSQMLLAGSSYRIRHQCLSTVRISPYQYNPVSRVLKRLVKATLNIRIVSSTGKPFDPPVTSASPDPQFEHVYKDVLWNYDQAKQWRTTIVDQQTSRGVDPTRDWFETGRTYYRIRIAEDGWYRVTKSDLAAAGANTSLIDINTLQIFGKGQEIPVFIRPDTTIEFYALMNHGDSTYLDFYTDTNTYWLTWGGSVQGQRFASVLQPGGPAGLNIISAKVTRHFEQTTDYYEGTGDVEITDNGPVPGEGWVWDYYFPGTVNSHPFTIDNIDATNGPTSTLRLRLFSTTPHFNQVDHDAKLFINDSLVNELMFQGRTEQLVSTTFPTSFINGFSRSQQLVNDLKIRSIPTASIPNQFYLDWFEIDYQRSLQAQGNQLFFQSPPSSGTNPALFTVTGFSNSSIDIFDLTGKRKVTGGIVTGDSLSGYSIAFRDTFSTVKNYLVVSTGGQRPVLPLDSKVFADIRVNIAGADYLIISHRLFLPAAQQLAAHRQSVNGVRVKVVDVQEIYDEFNYGMLNATVIKNFLRHVYLNWPAPALTYVLMFGDASWDFHHYIASTTELNFVPAYGVPAGDNWFGCFNPDTTFLSSLLIGRIPVRDTVQAQRAVAKLMSYDNYTLGDWNKNFMFITGGNTLGEQGSFNNLSNFAIGSYVTPPPIGGTPFRIYKSSLAVIDGEWKQPMRDLVRDGLVYMNFLGHSGGRVWGVDIGDPNTLENTNGRLPFLSSVSCNVGAFAEPSKKMLAEEFVLADNRGSIASWASSSLGYANAGASLNQYFLEGVKNNIRDLGSLTTAARIRLWQTYGNFYVYVAMVNLNPLLGDPLTRLAMPRSPDLALTTQDIALNTLTPSPNDSIFTIRVSVHNYGLVPLDSVGVTIMDVYNSQSTPIISNKKIARTLSRDTLFIPWAAAEKVGRHTLTVTLDPTNGITEVNEANNVASIDQYIYANLLSVVKPFNNMVVSPGLQTLVVTSPLGLDSVGFQYFFELDTVATFDSPFRISSSGVSPGPVSGQWTTPNLVNNQVYFWRARTVDGTLQGNWVVSSFVTSSLLPSSPLVRWREYSPRQFNREHLKQAAVTDSGVTIAPNLPLNLIARSFGVRAIPPGPYNTIVLNGIVVTGYNYVIGTGVMAMRVNEFNGLYEVGGGVGTTPWHPDSMMNFIRNTPAGNYIAIVAINDARQTLNESLYVAIEAMGSSAVRQVLAGQSWAFIGRKGYSNAGLESLTNDSAIVSLQILNYYSFGAGSLTTTGFSMPMSWDSFHWRHSSSPPATTSSIALLGVRANGGIDTLRILSGDSTDVSLALLNPLTSGPTYTALASAALLSATDALRTPVLKDWWVDFLPSSDLAVSSRTVGVQDLTIQKGTQLNLPVTVYNIGFGGVDSARIVVSVFDKFNKARPIASAMLDTIPVNGLKSTTISIPTTNFSRWVTLQVNVSPSKKYKDLVPDNNNA